MSDLDYLDEMENTANMRTTITKLPYRLRERFRSVAVDIQKKEDRRTRFKDIVEFVNRQAEMASHPVFGELKDKVQGQTKHLPDKRLDELWTQQFKYDFPENAQGEQLEMSKEDQLFMDRVSYSVKLVNGHYSIGLPLKNKAVKMPNNRALAEQRAINIKKKLQRDQSFQEDYVSFMGDVINKELCRLRISWDDAVPEHLAQQWSKWMEELRQLSDFGVDRCFKPPEFGEAVKAQLHHFCDTSETGYGTVTYLVQQNSSNQIHCAFVLGKARVAPLKPTTIPQLELTAATLAVKMEFFALEGGSVEQPCQLKPSTQRFYLKTIVLLI
ncbi:hypothetical protein AAFF_G00179280 [Aldrovandia affinis]|uniref:Uncharacterized protein n=1 Tax=Aldrovandia affinis TaxID=143900 RepID=A0AAD7RKL7_9TELE|nr:hypothetical protein AAFF_G00179280 [Aldrovandia affinis]